MKLLEHYHQSIANYEGAIQITTNDGHQESGYFEAIQTSDGNLIIGCLVNDFFHFVTYPKDVTIEAVDIDGWKLSLERQIVYQSLSPALKHNIPMTTMIIRPQCLRAKKIPERSLKYLVSRFFVTNLILNRDTKSLPSIITYF